MVNPIKYLGSVDYVPLNDNDINLLPFMSFDASGCFFFIVWRSIIKITGVWLVYSDHARYLLFKLWAIVTIPFDPTKVLIKLCVF